MAVEYYVDEEKKAIRPDLFCEEAEKWAERFMAEIKLPKKKTQNQNYTPIRKFYNQVLAHRNRIEDAGSDDGPRDAEFRNQLPYIRMLAAKASYAHHRGTINQEIRDFITEQVKGIKTLRDFQTFCDFFEAILAYLKGRIKE